MLRAVVSGGADQVPRRLVLEEAGAFICSFSDVTRRSGVRWEGRLVIASEMRSFEASSLGELCDQMEAVQQLGRVSVGSKAPPGIGDQWPPAVTDYDASGVVIGRLPRRPRQPGTHRMRRR